MNDKIEDAIQFAALWNDVEEYPTVAEVAKAAGLSYSGCKNKASIINKRRREGMDLAELIDRSKLHLHSLIPEMQYQFFEAWSEEACIVSLRNLAMAHPGRSITRNFYRSQCEVSDSTWNRYFGTFLEFKRQSGLELSRTQHDIERKIAKHVSSDHYREISVERREYAEKYIRPSGKRFQTMLICSDLHDELIDPFYLRVLIDTAKRVQPEIIVFNGDVWDATEFGKYAVDPRAFDVVGKIKFVHENILAPLRQACPDAQIDWISGNHEDRLVKHLADATPALKVLLSDLHGFTVGSLLGLDKYHVNFIAKSDLAAYTVTNIKNEVAKNYKVYFDCYVTNHFPDGMRLGLPGTNGHCHKFVVTACHNEIFGSFSWIQTGCGHMKDASYCNGEKWDMGFLLVHVDTQTKRVNQEYIPVTDFSVVGGKYYFREPSDFVRVVG